MREFLQREWSNREIAPEVFVEAREQAWNRLQPGRSRRFLLWPAIPATVALLLLVWFLWPQEMVRPDLPIGKVALTELPLEPTGRPRIADPLPPVQPFPVEREIANATELDPPAVTESAARPVLSEGRPKRVVMNFVLPRSGVRMIWIKENYSIVGEE